MATKSFLVVRDGEPPDGLCGAVVAIGNFDGVHRGHRAVIGAAMKRAKALGQPAAVMTFEPHPRAFFKPDEPLFRLTDEAAKLRLLASTGLDGAIVLTFDAALAKLTAEEFVSRILVERFAVSSAVIGFNFHFGVNRAGSPDFLMAQGKKYGFAVEVVPRFEDDGRPVMRLRHFDSTLGHAREDKDTPMLFVAANCTTNSVTLDGTGDQAGEHFIYTREGNRMKFVGEFIHGGKPIHVEVEFTGAAPP